MNEVITCFWLVCEETKNGLNLNRRKKNNQKWFRKKNPK